LAHQLLLSGEAKHSYKFWFFYAFQFSLYEPEQDEQTKRQPRHVF